MSCVVRKIKDRQYILLEFGDIVTISELEQGRITLKELVEKSNEYRKALVDMRNASLAVSAIDIHQFISSYVDELPLGCLIALVMQPKYWNIAILAEKSTSNHGIYLKAFENYIYASAWLGTAKRHS